MMAMIPPSVKGMPSMLLDLLSTTLILDHVVAHLPVSSLFALSATSKEFSSLILRTTGVFRYLDLSRCRGAQIKHSGPLDAGGNVWRVERMDEALTEDDFYSGPLRGIFSNMRRRDLLRHVQVLVLDKLSVTSDLLTEIVTSDYFSIRLLSVVGCQNLNQAKLQQLLRYICRPGRPEGTPRLKGIYVFGKKKVRRNGRHNDLAGDRLGVMSAPETQRENFSEENLVEVFNDEAWWYGCGQVLDVQSSAGAAHTKQRWAQTIESCAGIIAFDGVLCPNKQHYLRHGNESSAVNRPLATVSLGQSGCTLCGGFPQLRNGPLHWGSAPANAFPLLSPLPHSGKLDLAAAPPHGIGHGSGLVVSCEQCLKGRWCSECNKYWCFDCYAPDQSENLTEVGGSTAEISGLPRAPQITGDDSAKIKKPPVFRECWECGPLCETCLSIYRRRCRSCRTPYCRAHNDGSDDEYCEWCRLGGRRTRELY